MAGPKKAPLMPPMRRRRPQPLLVLAFVMVMAALMFAADLPGPAPDPGLKAAQGRLRVYYGNHPPGNDWQLIEIAVRAGEVWVDLGLPGTQAAALIQGADEKMLAALRGHCPPRSDPAGSVLLQTQDIEIRGVGADGKALAAVSCRASHK